MPSNCHKYLYFINRFHKDYEYPSCSQNRPGGGPAEGGGSRGGRAESQGFVFFSPCFLVQKSWIPSLKSNSQWIQRDARMLRRPREKPTRSLNFDKVGLFNGAGVGGEKAWVQQQWELDVRYFAYLPRSLIPRFIQDNDQLGFRCSKRAVSRSKGSQVCKKTWRSGAWARASRWTGVTSSLFWA